MNPRAVTFMGWCLAFAGLGALATPPAVDPETLQLNAYVALARANQASENGNPSQAAEHYAEALNGYRALAEAFPDWQRDIVQYRLADCAQRLEAAEREAVAAAPPQPAPKPEAAPTISPAEFNALREENAYLRERLKGLAEATEAPVEAPVEDIHELEAEAEALADQLREARAKLTAVELREREAQRQLTTCEAERAALAGLTNRVNALMLERTEEAALRARLGEQYSASTSRVAALERLLNEAIRTAQAAAERLQETERLAANEAKARDKAERSLTPLREEQSETTRALEACRAELDIAREGLEAVEREHRKAVQKLKKADAREDALRGEHETLIETNRRLKQEMDACNEAVAGAHQTIETLNRKLDAQAEALSQAEADQARNVTEPKSAAQANNLEVQRVTEGSEADVGIETSGVVAKLGPPPAEAIERGIALCRAGRYDEGVRELEALAETYSDAAETQAALGAALLGARRFAESRACLNRALSLDPNAKEAHYNLAQAYFYDSPQDIDNARIHYLRAVELGVGRDLILDETLLNNNPAGP